MHLTSPFVRLPFQFDAERLAAEVGSLPESAWKPHPHGYPGNAAVPLVAANGDPGDDRTSGEMRPTPQLAALPYVRQVMAALQLPVGRTRLMRIDGNGEATRHVDSNYYWQTHVRIHVPVLTTPNVAFECGETRVHMRAGECWIFDTWSTHNVLNPDPTRRIHLVIDSVGSEPFWARVAAGDRPTELHPPAFAAPVAVPFDPSRDAQPPFERFNQPLVMSPGEVAHWFDLAATVAGASASAHPEAALALAGIARDFGRAWSAAYAEFGPMARGHATYRHLLQELDRALECLPSAFAAANGVRITEFVRQMIVRVALNPELGGQYQQASTPAPAAREAAHSATATPAPPPIAAVPAAGKTRRRFDRPVFVVSPPRSGSSLLFETLVQSPTAWSIGGESHRLIEQIPALSPASVGFESNRIGADKATAMTVAELVHGFFGQVRDREGRRAAADATDLRLVEKTPKNALRVPFLATAFDDAHFLVLHREPRDVLSSMLDAWRSGRFVTYPALPGWSGAPWSLVLTPGWRDWAALPLHELVARQWRTLVDTLLDDLEAIDPKRVVVSDYAELLHDPNAEVRRLCVDTGLGWDRDLADLPLSRHTLTPPDPDKWKRNADEVQAMLAVVQPTAARFAAFVRRHRGTSGRSSTPSASVAAVVAPRQEPVAAAAPVPAAKTAGNEAVAVSKQAFGSVFTASMSSLVAQSGGTLVVTTYQSGRTILVRNDQGSINTHFKAFHSPMGVAYDRQRLALATGRSVIEMHNHVGVAETLQPPGKHDACFVPRNVHYTGDIRIHEIGFAQNELWIVNTRFSCLATLDGVHNFVPRWKPKFISAIEPGDRCHLNGMCIVDDRVRFVSALAATDTPGGWREHKADGGLLIDIDSHEIVARGLSMPHSPRWYDGRLWVLESGKGALSTIDLATGQASVVCELPGFTRGLAFHGPYAFIGLSQIRESVFGGLPIVERLTERLCGVWAVDLRSGRIAGFLRFEGAVQEIFDVQLLPGLRFPELFEPEDERLASAFVLPNAPRPAVRPAA